MTKLQYLLIGGLFVTTCLFIWKQLMGKTECEIIYSFEDIDDLFTDPDLSCICINTIWTNRPNKEKYIFIYEGESHIVDVDFWGTPVEENGQKQKACVADVFNQKLRLLHKKGIAGICPGFDDIVKIKMKNFNRSQISTADTAGLYNSYKYINVAQSDISYSFVPHPYYSKLFRFDHKSFYYSNK